MMMKTVTVKVMTVPVFAEEAAVCCPLPSTDCDSRGDDERVRSRR